MTIGGSGAAIVDGTCHQVASCLLHAACSLQSCLFSPSCPYCPCLPTPCAANSSSCHQGASSGCSSGRQSLQLHAAGGVGRAAGGAGGAAGGGGSRGTWTALPSEHHPTLSNHTSGPSVYDVPHTSHTFPHTSSPHARRTYSPHKSHAAMQPQSLGTNPMHTHTGGLGAMQHPHGLAPGFPGDTLGALPHGRYSKPLMPYPAEVAPAGTPRHADPTVGQGGGRRKRRAAELTGSAAVADPRGAGSSYLQAYPVAAPSVQRPYPGTAPSGQLPYPGGQLPPRAHVKRQAGQAHDHDHKGGGAGGEKPKRRVKGVGSGGGSGGGHAPRSHSLSLHSASAAEGWPCLGKHYGYACTGCAGCTGGR